MSTTRRSTAPFRVGDRVKVEFGRGRVVGVIVEDFGALGVNRRHIYRVEIPNDPFEPTVLELSEDDLVAAKPEDDERTPLQKKEVIDYLRYGGLLSILGTYARGERNPPRAWLTRDSLGGVTHTFAEERGLLGGHPSPPSALWGVKIFAPKKEAVVSYLEGFGLTRREAEAIVAEVGTAK